MPVYKNSIVGDRVPIVDVGGYLTTTPKTAETMSQDYGAILATIQAQQIIGKSDKKYKIVACVLRCTSGTWAIFEDANHESVNVASVASDSSKITLTFDFTASKVGTFVCVPDETYVLDGLQFGATCGLNDALITCAINKTIGGYIYYNGSAWVVSNAPGVSSVTWSTDKLIITNENMFQQSPNIYKATISGRGGAYLPQLGSFGLTTIDVEFYDYAGTKITTPDTNMKFYFSRTSFGIVRPQDIGTVAGSNIWVFGIFEVE
jgi:hypothetical protein